MIPEFYPPVNYHQGGFFEPLEKEISVEDMQKIVDANMKKNYLKIL